MRLPFTVLWLLVSLSLSGCFLSPGPQRVSHDGHDHAHDDAYYAELARSYAPFVAEGALQVAAHDRDLYGEWGPVLDWPHVAVSAANLPDGRILSFASNERTSFPVGNEYTYAAVWNPQDGSFLEVPHTSHDMFCAATTMLEDGSIFVNGGRNDSPMTSVFDFQTNSWQSEAFMNRGRWYPGSVALPGGEVMTAVGRSGDRYPELWSAAGGWRLLAGADLSSTIINRQTGYQNTWLPYLHLMPSGEVFYAGPTDAMSAIDPSGNGANSPTGAGADWYFKYGTGLMYGEGKLLITGGGDADSSHNEAAVVDLNGSSPLLRNVAPMRYARKFSNGTVLPSGEVLILGGNSSGTEFSDVGSVLTPELWDPDSETWRELADMAVPRNYHSVALLLTDGRVLSAGGGLCNCASDHPDAQIYSPPYLFNPDGSPATRPQISAAPESASAGQTITVEATAGLAGFSLVKMSATNHHLNSDLRRLEPAFSETNPGRYALALNANPNVLTPGYWMLFALDTQGTPSVAAVLQIRTTAPKVSHPGNQSHTEGESVNLTVQALDPNGDPLRYSASGLPTGLSINPNSGQISGVVSAAGSYNVTLTVSDTRETSEVTFDWLVYTAGNEPGLSYQYFEGSWTSLPDFSTLLPVEVGTVATFDLAPRNQLDHFGFRFEGNLRVAQAGSYTFYLRADDRATLWLDGDPIVTGDYRSEARGTVDLSKGDHRITVSHFEGGGGERLSLDYSGPNLSRRPIPASALFQLQAPIDSYRYVKLESLAGAGPAAAVAEFRLLDSSGAALPRGAWTVFADSEETQSLDGRAANAVDGDGGSLWQSGLGGHPHHLIFSLGQGEVVGGFRYLPSPMSAASTAITDYRFYGSNDALTWTLLDEGSFAADSSEKTVLLNPVNQAPVINGPAEISSGEGESVAYPLNASDPDGDALHYSATGLPPGLGLDETSGLISGSLPYGSAGSYVVTLSVSDGELTSELVFNWIVGVTNRPPSLGALADQSGANGVSVSLPVYAEDPDGDVLSYSSSGLPDGLVQDSTSGVISGLLNMPGTYSVALSVSDGRGGSDSSSFVWQVEAVPALGLEPLSSVPVARGSAVTYRAVSSGGVNPRYRWLFGDGSPETGLSTDPEASHSYTEPGRYVVTVTAVDERGDEVTAQFVQLVHEPLSAGRPAVSMSILFESGRVWNVNPDNDTVSVLDAQSLAKLAEVAVAAGPRALALAPDGRIWVTAKDAAQISIVDPGTLAVVQTLELPRASQPHGIVFDPGGAYAYVALEAGGRVLKLNAASGAEIGSAEVGLHVRHLSLDASGSNLYASRFISPPVPGEGTASPQVTLGGGEVLLIASSSMSVTDTLTLRHSDAPDAEPSGRGLPNYLGPAVISPSGLWAWVPSKQDNLLRGSLRDGRDLTFEHTVRSISSKLDLMGKQELYSARVDHDNAGVASSAAFGPYGSYLFVALEGSREVGVVETYSNTEVMRFATGRAPQGLVLAPDGHTLYVHSFMDRSVSAFDVGALIDRGEASVRELGVAVTVSSEALAPQVLLGKQLFYDAKDTRLARDAYISCAACHNDGGHDGRVWDFTGAGEGLRTTISLEGHAGAQGRLHWSGNFDEIQDFEGQIRRLSGGTGLMSAGDFAATQDPLGPSKAGLSPDLDALAAYVASLTSFGASPYREASGALTAAGAAGKALFEAEGCASCHSGDAFSDSDQGALHDIGTLKPSSGNRLGETLSGIDTPTLRGLWNSAPYLHDGSAATLAEAVAAHSGVSLSSSDLDTLAAYLRQIDGTEPAPKPVTINAAPGLSPVPDQSHSEGDTVALQLSASDPDGDALSYSVSGLPAGLNLEGATGLISGTLATGSAGVYTVSVSASDPDGDSDSGSFTWTVAAPPVNTTPTLDDPGNQLNRVGDAVTLQLSASDPDGDPLDFTATDLPTGLSLDSATGLISGAPSVPGDYSVTLGVSDGAATTSLAILWTVEPALTGQTLEVRVGASSDDAEERSDGSLYLLSSDLELTEDAGPQTVGLRFTDLDVPQGARIVDAYLQFQVDESSSGAAQLSVAAQASDHAASFGYTYRDISSRARTGAAVTWSPAAWDSVNAAGLEQRTPDLSAVVQEIVSRPGWRSGNALVFVITGSGKRVAEAYDGVPAAAPLLHLSYEVDGGPQNSPPNLTTPAHQTHQEGDSVSLQLSANDADGDALLYSASGLPAGLSLDDSSGLISGTLASGSVGSYGVTVSVSDPSGASDSASFTWVVSSAATGTPYWFTAGIVASEDDAEEYVNSGSVRLFSTDLELGAEQSAQAVGIRYRSVNIPRGAVVRRAYLTFTTDEDSPGAASLRIRGEASSGAAPYSETPGNITARALTGSSVLWTGHPDWQVGEQHVTPDLSAIVQEIISRSDWQSGDPVAFVITGSGTKVAESFDGERGSAPQLAIEYLIDSLPSSLDLRVASGQDDAEERSDGSIYRNSSDLELVTDQTRQTVGLRFTNVAIPQGATITGAHLQFKVDEASSDAAQLELSAHAADDAAPFTYTNADLSSRPRSSTQLVWSPPAWPTVGAEGAEQRSPDLTAILQEIVNRPGWRMGNALVILIEGDGKRVAEAFDGDPAGAPLLHVDFE